MSQLQYERRDKPNFILPDIFQARSRRNYKISMFYRANNLSVNDTPNDTIILECNSYGFETIFTLVVLKTVVAYNKLTYKDIHVHDICSGALFDI